MLDLDNITHILNIFGCIRIHLQYLVLTSLTLPFTNFNISYFLIHPEINFISFHLRSFFIASLPEMRMRLERVKAYVINNTSKHRTIFSYKVEFYSKGLSEKILTKGGKRSM